MKKFTLFDFVNDNSLQIGETSWIQDLPSDDNELERLLKPNEHVLVNWPVGERKTEKHLVKVVYMSDDPQELVEMMQKILRADEITKIQVLGKGKRKRIEMIFSESEDSDLDKEQGKMMKHIKTKKSLQASAPANILSQLETSLINKQREPYSESNLLYTESSSDDEEPLFQLSKVELCAKIKSLKRKLTDTMRENCRLRQSLVMLQVLPQAVTHFEELVGMAEALLKGGVTSSTSSLHSHAVWKASHNPLADSYAAMHSNSSSPITLNVEEEEQQTEKQFKIEKWQIALCNKSKPQKFINDLMQALYTHEYMATHSLTGAKSSSSKDKAAKPAMNQNEVQEIIGITKQLFPNTDDALIRRMMGQKLNNCTKKPILSKDLNSGAFQKQSFCSPSSNEVERGQEKIVLSVPLVTTHTHKLLTFKTGDTTTFISFLAATSSLPTSSAFPQNTIMIQEKKFQVKSNETDKSPSQIHKAEVKQGKGECVNKENYVTKLTSLVTSCCWETKNSTNCTFNVNISNSVINCVNSGSTAAPQGIMSSAVPPRTQDQQDDDSPAANAQLQQSDSCLTPPPPTSEGQQACLKTTSSKVESQLSSSSPAPSPNQSCERDLRDSDKV